MKPTPANIEHFKQNRPSLIIADLKRFNVPEQEAAEILMARGVYKWLAVRRRLIKLKNVWKDQIRGIHVALRYASGAERKQLAARLKALEECRKQVRALCHSTRWQFPDNDPKSARYFNEH